MAKLAVALLLAACHPPRAAETHDAAVIAPRWDVGWYCTAHAGLMACNRREATCEKERGSNGAPCNYLRGVACTDDGCFASDAACREHMVHSNAMGTCRVEE